MAKSVAIADPPATGLRAVAHRPARLGEFLRDVRSEMHKVVTPTRAEVQQTTAIVLVTVLLFAAYFWVVDTVVGQLIERVLNRLTVHS